MGENIRQAAVAGTFYPADPATLRKELSERIDSAAEKQKVHCLISPHAGYFYSGNCAGKGFGAVQVPDTVIILGVDHHGMGYSFAVDGHEKWASPLGDIVIDQSLRKELLEDSQIFRTDLNAGLKEHSIEVQVPFIQYLNPNARILPILISSFNYKELALAGEELAQLIRRFSDQEILIVAATDMSHYISASAAKMKDELAIDRIQDLDPQGLLETVKTERITMCGVSPVTTALLVSKELGADSTRLIEYTNSGEVSGDYHQVVGYLSMTIY